MKRRIKPLVLNIATTIVLILGVIIIFDNIIEITSEIEISRKNIEIETMPITKLILKAGNTKDKGPKPKSEKIAYITIDDGPSKYTNDILHVLNRNDIKATFFMIERNMRKYPDYVKRLVDEGHAAGFHSVSHDINILYNSPESTVNEFNKCKSTLNDLTGSISNLIRLPYGSKPYAPRESYNELVNSGYKIWDWNLDTQDWKATSEEIVHNVEVYSNGHRELVLLMHEKEQTVKSLQDIIDILKSKGYTILPIEENDYPKNYWQQNLSN